jgi:hypothetical protein
MRLAARSMISVLSAAALLGTMACGGGDDDPIVVEGDHHTYVVSRVDIPVDGEQADELGFDLDGDGVVDNQLGNILAALITAAPAGSLDLQGSIDEAIAEGSILLLADIQATALTQAANAGFRLFLGDNPTPAPCTGPEDTVCGRHLTGDGSFTIAAGSPTDIVVGGNIVGGRFTGGPGRLSMQIAFGDTSIDLVLVRARAEINGITVDGFGQSRVGGAVPNENVQNEVIPAVAEAIRSFIAEDCTGTGDNCGCTPDSTGSTLLGIFDTNGDCQVPTDEVRNHSLIRTLLRPDLDTTGDGTPDALSVGVGARGVKGSYPVPD